PPWTHDFGPGFRCDLGSPFLWILVFWRSKRKYLAKGETLQSKKSSRQQQLQLQMFPNRETHWIQKMILFIAASYFVVLPLRVEYNLQHDECNLQRGKHKLPNWRNAYASSAPLITASIW
ncbi:MAG: hypothetical protein KJ556_18975, partial [Gammaproteobacteria bacterium]|nr:hypothetical protein [Gammaproteobacteria bacterium]MBU2246084.1 hypothetical protein [Gammaproteobacteria bacterium]